MVSPTLLYGATMVGSALISSMSSNKASSRQANATKDATEADQKKWDEQFAYNQWLQNQNAMQSRWESQQTITTARNAQRTSWYNNAMNVRDKQLNRAYRGGAPGQPISARTPVTPTLDKYTEPPPVETYAPPPTQQTDNPSAKKSLTQQMAEWEDPLNVLGGYGPTGVFNKVFGF